MNLLVNIRCKNGLCDGFFVLLILSSRILELESRPILGVKELLSRYGLISGK